MTPHSSYFSSYTGLSSNKHIIVIHVPKLSNSLLFIQKVTQYLNYAVVFFHSHCVFRDFATRKTIGIAKEQGELYYL